MCIVPGLGFNHEVRGLAKAILTFLGFLGGAAFGLCAMVIIDQKYHGFWTPTLFCMAFAFLLGYVPNLKPSLRWGYAVLVFGTTATTWMLSRPKMHKDLMEFWFHLGPKVTGVIALIGILWFSVAYWKQAKRPPLIWFLVLIAEASLVGYFSSAIGGKTGMVEILESVFHLSPATAEPLAVVLRKCIHFTFYGLVALSAFHFAKVGGADKRRTLLLGLAYGLSFACFDELRQSEAADRTASMMDVALDMAGALTMCGLAYRRLK